MLKQWYKYGTSCAIQAAPQQGKSRLAQHCIREHAMNGVPFGLVDFHGTFYQQVLDYLAFLKPETPIYLLNPSEPDFINPFNPFRFKTTPDTMAPDITAHVARHAETIIKAWGAENSNELPTYERIIKAVLTLCAVSGEPLHHCAKLLQLPKKELREWAISIIKDDEMKQEWTELQYLSKLRSAFREWKHEVLSVRNRLQRFIGSTAVKMFTGLPGGIDINQIWEEGGILLVNLKPSAHLSPESAKVFGALLQSEFLHAARMNMHKERPYFLYCDEFQEWATTDAAALINETPKSGLRLTFIYHSASEFHKQPHIAEALNGGANIKITFGGQPAKQATETAADFFMGELNERKKKDDRFVYLTEYDEDFVESVTQTDYGDASSVATTTSPRLVPYHERIVDGQEDYTLEEKKSQLAGRLMALKRGECYVKLPGQEAYLWQVPHVADILHDGDTVLRFKESTQTQSFRFDEAQQKLQEQEKTFFERSRGHARPDKKPLRLRRPGRPGNIQEIR